MTIKIMAFGITRDILGKHLVEIELPEGCSVLQLQKQLKQEYPKLAQLKSLLIAVNEDYGEDNYVLKATDDIALIPPVSGG